MKLIVCFMPQLVELDGYKLEPLTTPPMVLYLIYSILKNANYNVVIVDPYEFYQFEDNDDLISSCAEYLSAKIADDDIVCFSSNTFNWNLTKIITNKLAEKNPKQKIVLGGLHPSIFDKHALKVTKATLVIRAESEKKLLEVIEALDNNLPLSNITGITYRNEGVIVRNSDESNLTLVELQESPLPNFSMIPIQAKYKSIPVESSRGCMFSCAFCSIPHRHNWRGITVEELEIRVINSLKYASLFSAESTILFVDDCFTADTTRAKTIMCKIKNWIGYKQFHIEVRATDVVNSDLFSNMDISIIKGMQIGVECGYNEGLKKIKKGLTIERLYAALTKLCENGFKDKICLSFIIGFPWEGLEEINKTLDTVEDISNKFGVFCNLNWMILLPSDLWYERKRYNIEIDESMYDGLSWFYDEVIFYKSHPLLTKKIVEEVEDRIQRIREKGSHRIWISSSRKR